MPPAALIPTGKAARRRSGQNAAKRRPFMSKPASDA
jgi:hypothetical protein